MYAQIVYIYTYIHTRCGIG